MIVLSYFVRYLKWKTFSNGTKENVVILRVNDLLIKRVCYLIIE